MRNRNSEEKREGETRGRIAKRKEAVVNSKRKRLRSEQRRIARVERIRQEKESETKTKNQRENSTGTPRAAFTNLVEGERRRAAVGSDRPRPSDQIQKPIFPKKNLPGANTRNSRQFLVYRWLKIHLATCLLFFYYPQFSPI